MSGRLNKTQQTEGYNGKTASERKKSQTQTDIFIYNYLRNQSNRLSRCIAYQTMSDIINVLGFP